jgi:diguanylate cyclase (GGDEF)-like protein
MQHAFRVLVVDDDVLVRAQLCALLHTSGYEVETAASGEDALRLLRSYPCDVVVTDWQMPKMDGLTLCRQIRATEQQAYIYLLMLTVKRSPQELLAGLAGGADDYVIKGTSDEEFLARMKNGRRIAQWRATHQSRDGEARDLPPTDAATGAYSLAYLMEHLPREVARSERYGHSLTLLSCEIDAIAGVNEQFGCAAGEQSVRRFISLSTACIRKPDWLVRIGSREFVVVLPDTNRTGAQCVARKLSESYAGKESADAKRPFRRGVNIKVTAIAPKHDAEGAALIQTLLRRAEDHRRCEARDEIRAPGGGGAHYLSDMVAGGDAESVGRNWPAT